MIQTKNSFLPPGKTPVNPVSINLGKIRNRSSYFSRKFCLASLTAFLFCLAMVGDAIGQSGDFPVPPNNPNQLFYLQRPANSNTVIYELNAVNGIPDKKQPIHVFWIKYAKNGEKEALTDLENKYAYGVKVTALDDKTFEFYLKAYKKIKLTLREGEDKQYHVYTTVGTKPLLVTRIFIAVKGGSLFKPKIDHVELAGINTSTGEAVTERIFL